MAGKAVETLDGGVRRPSRGVPVNTEQ